MYPFGHPFGAPMMGQPGVVVVQGAPGFVQPMATVTVQQPVYQPPQQFTTTTVQSYGYQGVPSPQPMQTMQTMQQVSQVQSFQQPTATFQQPANSLYNTVQPQQQFQQSNFQQTMAPAPSPHYNQGGFNQQQPQQNNIYATQQAPAPSFNQNQGNFNQGQGGYQAPPQQRGNYNQGQGNYNQPPAQGNFNQDQQGGGYNLNVPAQNQAYNTNAPPPSYSPNNSGPQQGGYNPNQPSGPSQNQGGGYSGGGGMGGYAGPSNLPPRAQVGGYNPNVPRQNQTQNQNQNQDHPHTPSYHTTTSSMDYPAGFVAPEQTPPPAYSTNVAEPIQAPPPAYVPPAPISPRGPASPRGPTGAPISPRTGGPGGVPGGAHPPHLGVPAPHAPGQHTSSAGAPQRENPVAQVPPQGAPKKAAAPQFAPHHVQVGNALTAMKKGLGKGLHTGPLQQQTTSSGGQHSYSEQELRAFTEYINTAMASDPDIARSLPMNPTSTDLFTLMTESVLLCKLINFVKAGTIDERKIVRKPNLSVLEKIQNHELAIKGAKDLGCNIINIGGHDLLEEKPYLLLGMIWQIIEKGLLGKISLDAHPELISLLEAHEDMASFANKNPAENLLRWFNYHLGRAGHKRRVNNFGKDIMDAENYLVLLSQLAPDLVPRDVLLEADPVRRAQMVCDYAQKMDALKFVTPDDILAGNDKLNLAFTAYLFHKYPGLTSPSDQSKLEEAERVMKEKYLQEELDRKNRWQSEEAERQRRWQAEEADRLARLRDEEDARRKRWEEEEAAMKAKLNEEERKKREELERQEAELRRRQQESEAASRAQAEERRRQEILAEQARLAEEDRRRRWEAEQQMQARMYAEEEARRRAEEARRAEENRRLQFEAEQRRAEEERQRIATEQEAARVRAWDEYNAKQEQLRQQAWTTYYQQQQQQTTMMQTQQALAATTTTTVTSFVPPPPMVTTMTITKSIFPINRLMLHVIRARRLIPTGVVLLPDPYCFISRGGERYKTPHISNTNDPVWNSTYEMRMITNFDEIVLDVFDRNLIGKDRFMGQVRLTKQDFLLLGERWYGLRSRTYKADQVHGEILIGIDHA